MRLRQGAIGQALQGTRESIPSLHVVHEEQPVVAAGIAKVIVVHLVAGDLNGGAARGAYGLHKALQQAGVDSKLVTTGPQIADPSVISLASAPAERLKTLALRRLDHLAVAGYRRAAGHPFSAGIFGRDVSTLPCVRDADIVHLHWINRGLLDVSSLRRLNKPIVWTLRDMWPFTGGCHYSMGCERYRADCGACPQLGSTRINDVTRRMARRKQKDYPSNMRVVAISRWLAELASSSRIFAGRRIDFIPNGIDCDLFTPEPCLDAKASLRISTNKKLILIGAQRLGESYKGFDKLLAALTLLDTERFALCVFGNGGREDLSRLNFETFDLGFVSSDHVMRSAYSAADVFVAPSTMEAFGKTIAESMACGTPVVCFDAGGPREIVDHLVTGYCAPPYRPDGLATGVEWVVRRNDMEMRARNRAKIVSSLSASLAARRYLSFYEEMLRSGFPANE